MRRVLILVAATLAIFDAGWLLYLSSPKEPDYLITTEANEWWFKDEANHIEDVDKLPVWDGKQWTLAGRLLPSIESEVGNRPLVNDDRCVLEYRLDHGATLGDFLSAQRQAEDAGTSIMIVTAPVDVDWLRRGQNPDWFLFNSLKHSSRCGV